MNLINNKIYIILFFLIFHLISCKTDKNTPETTNKEKIFRGPIVINSVIKDASKYGKNDGSVDITVSGGTQPYTFSWSGGETSEDLKNIPAGIYVLTVTDKNKITASDSIIVNQPDPDSLVLSFELTHPEKLGEYIGSIDLTVLGGLRPYSYQWSTGSKEEDLDNLEPGEYIVTVIDRLKNEITDTVQITEPVVTDIDGNTYRMAKIGKQIWMRENLKVSRAPNGTLIKSYDYNNNPKNSEIYGKLYTWDIAMNGSNIEMAQGICPSGWHIPSDDEWKILEKNLGMDQSGTNMENVWRGIDVGSKLKKGGNSGYDALLSGRRTDEGVFDLLNKFEHVWTSTEYGAYAWRRTLAGNSSEVGRWYTYPKTYALSVRCIKDK